IHDGAPHIEIETAVVPDTFFQSRLQFGVARKIGAGGQGGLRREEERGGGGDREHSVLHLKDSPLIGNCCCRELPINSTVSVLPPSRRMSQCKPYIACTPSAEMISKSLMPSPLTSVCR